MRRFFIGLVSGGIVAALGLGVVSQITPPRMAAVVDDPGDTAAVPAAGVAAPDPQTDPQTDLADGADTPVTPDAPLQAPVAQTASDAPAVAAPVQTPAVQTPPGRTLPAQTPVSGAGSDAVAVVAIPEAAGADDPSHGVSGAGLETFASGNPAAPEAGPVDIAVEAVPERAVEQPAPEPDAAVVATTTAPPAAPLTEVQQPQLTPDVPDSAATPAGESTAALGVAGPKAPLQPGADTAPPLADLPPPPPLNPVEEVIVAQTPAPTDAPAPVTTSLDDTVVIVDEPAAALPGTIVEPETLPADAAPADAAPADAATAGAAPDVAVPEVDVAESTADAAPGVTVAPPVVVPQTPTLIDVDAAPSLLQPDTPLIEAAPALPATPSLGASGEGVIVNRPAAVAEAAPAEDAPSLPDVALDGQPPIARFAAQFANPDAKPLFSIVLIDTGEAALDRAAIASLPFPVSVVVDPLSPDAAAHAALYRAGGKEILMLASGIPEGATPADLEQTFEAHAAALPEAVAVVDTEEASFQDDRPLATQIVPILAAQGRGLLTWDRGLNAADQVAQREGLAAAVIFRRIDGDGEGVPVIRRYLDRAAFKAAQEGRVTVIGEARPETVAALVEWAIEGRASTVAIAPISALLARP